METRWFGRHFLLKIVFLMMYLRITVQSQEDDKISVDGNLAMEDDVIHDIDEPRGFNSSFEGDLKIISNEGVGNEKHKKNLPQIEKIETTKDINLLIRSEPGFNYTTDEMKKFKIWDKGVIPYYIDDFSFDSSMREKIRKILHGFNRLTGIHFTELPSPPTGKEQRWVFFINRRGVLGCEDYTTSSFTIAGVQRVVLGYDCLGADANGAALAPTVLALAGVPPQHNSPDREDYIHVKIDNVISEKRHLFTILKDNEWLFHDIMYDYLSAGHYDFHKFTINGSATIVPQGELKYIFSGVGQADGISLKDIWKVRMLYNYISLDRHKAKLSDCSRIFKLGAAFQTIRPTESTIVPRDKPRKYSGIDLSYKTGQNNNNFQKDRNDTGYENKGEIVDAVSDADGSNLQLKKKNSKKNEKHNKLKSKLKELQNTDYDTDAG